MIYASVMPAHIRLQAGTFGHCLHELFPGAINLPQLVQVPRAGTDICIADALP